MAQDERTTLAGPNILLVATDLSTGGGVNKVIRDLAALLHERLDAGVQVVSARGDRPSTYAFPSNVPVRYCRARSLAAYFTLLFRLRRLRLDYVIGVWTQDNVLIVLAFLFSRTRVVVTEHATWNFHGPFVRLLRRLVYPLAWRVVVLNTAELAHYRRYLGNVRLLPNPVVLPPAPETGREKLIIAVGHLQRQKNFADAIRAMALAGLEANGWSLVVIGAGPEEQSLRQLIAELRLVRTSIHPPTPHIASWYARCSLILVTSRTEVFSLVLAEGMLGGAIPIAYATDGPAFVLEQFPEHLVEIDNVTALAERVRHFAEQPGLATLRERLGASIRERFSPEVIAEQWRELLS